MIKFNIAYQLEFTTMFNYFFFTTASKYCHNFLQTAFLSFFLLFLLSLCPHIYLYISICNNNHSRLKKKNNQWPKQTTLLHILKIR